MGLCAIAGVPREKVAYVMAETGQAVSFGELDIDVNARCLEDVDLTRVRIEAYDGRNWERAFASRPRAERTG